MSRRAHLTVLLVAVLALPVIAACKEAEVPHAAPAGARVVHFKSSDGVGLQGKLYGSGNSGVILSHQFNSDQSSWFGLAGELAADGLLVLTYDFRGYCPGGDAGCSEGAKDVAAATEDLAGAVTFMEGQGVRTLALVGASMGGTASLEAAAGWAQHATIPLGGVVAISAPASFEGLQVGPAQLQFSAPKLFVAGRDDPAGAADATRSFFDNASQPKELLVLPTDQHGAPILGVGEGGVGCQATDAIVDFLQKYGREG